MEWAEIFSNGWTYVIGFLGSVGWATLLGFVIALINGARFNKAISSVKQLIEEGKEQATDGAVNQIQTMSFKHDIQPLVESRLETINEKSLEIVEKTLGDVLNKYTKLVNVLQALANYFDNSIGVPENAKQALKDAIKDAQNTYYIDTPVESTVVIKHEEPKVEILEPKVDSKISR